MTIIYLAAFTHHYLECACVCVCVLTGDPQQQGQVGVSAVCGVCEDAAEGAQVRQTRRHFIEQLLSESHITHTRLGLQTLTQTHTLLHQLLVLYRQLKHTHTKNQTLSQDPSDQITLYENY